MLPQDKESTSNKLKKKKSLLGKKEINVRAKGNIFHHFFPTVLDNFNQTTQ